MTFDPRTRAQLKVWWMVWAATLPWVILLQIFVARPDLDPAIKLRDIMLQLVGVVPLFISIIIRWLALPRFPTLTGAFPLFIAGLALADGCGVFGIFLGGPYRDALFLLSVLGLLQFVPVFAKRLAEPKTSGFIPNN